MDERGGLEVDPSVRLFLTQKYILMVDIDMEGGVKRGKNVRMG